MTTNDLAVPATADSGAERPDMLRDLYADWSQVMATTELSMRLLRALFDEWHQPTVEPQDVTYREDTVGGVPGIWCLPLGADASQVLLFTHGGGFALGSPASHRKLAAHVAKVLDAVSFVPDYRRAPEHPHPAQVEDGVAVFEALVSSGVDPRDMTTVGIGGRQRGHRDPAALREQGKSVPGQVIAFSPSAPRSDLPATPSVRTPGWSRTPRTAPPWRPS